MTNIELNNKDKRILLRLKDLRSFDREKDSYKQVTESLLKKYKDSSLTSKKDIKSMLSKVDLASVESSNLIKSKVLKKALRYYNVERKDQGGKDSENLSLGFLLAYYNERLIINLMMKRTALGFTQKQVDLIKDFLDQFKLVTTSLLFSNGRFLDFSIESTKKSGNQKISKQTTKMILTSKILSIEDIIYICKDFQTHISVVLSRNKMIYLEINQDRKQEIVSSVINVIFKNYGTLARKHIIVEELEREIISTIDKFYTAFNDICSLLLDLSQDQRLFLIPQIFSLFYSNRGMKVRKPGGPKYIAEVTKTISAEEVTDVTIGSIEEFLPDLEDICQELGNLIDPNSFNFEESGLEDSKNLFISGKSGPNGQSALLNIPFDCKALLNDPELLDSIIELGLKFNLKIDKDLINQISNINVPDVQNQDSSLGEMKFRELDKKPTHSKLFIFKEGGNKDRVVAEVDSITQTVLTPIHDILSAISRQLGFRSAHYDQEAAFLGIFNSCQRYKFFGTGDLIAATDLLSVSLQSRIVESILKQRFNITGVGELWKDVISKKRKFTVDGLPEDQKISYKIGQPMGSKSSWVAMHLTIYLILRQATINVLKNSNTYNEKELLNSISAGGDDQAQAIKEVYKEVISIMQGLNLSLNLTKSFESDQTHVENLEDIRLFGEYLKKFILDRNFFTPLHPKKSSKFLISPQSFICHLVFDLLSLNVDVDLNDLIFYSILKDINCETDQKILQHPLTIDQYLERYSKVSEQLYFYLVGDSRILGCSVPGYYLEDYILNGSNPIFEEYLLRFNVTGISNRAYAYVLNSKINRIFYSAKNRADRAILSVFSNKALTAFKSLVEEHPETHENVLNSLYSEGEIDMICKVSGDTEIFKSDEIKVHFSKHPIALQIYKILFLQKKEITDKIQKLRKAMSLLQINNPTSVVKDKHIVGLEDILKRSKRTLNSIDLDSLIGTTELDEMPSPGILSSRTIKSIKDETERYSLIKEDSKEIIINSLDPFLD
jgi:hypothetical protein